MPDRDRSSTAGSSRALQVSKSASASSCQPLLSKSSARKETSLVQQHRIHAGDKIRALIVATGKMPPNHVIRYGQELPMLAGGTFDSRLFTDYPHPFMSTRRRVSRLARSSALKATRVDVVAPAKQRSEEGDLCFRRRSMIDSKATHLTAPDGDGSRIQPVSV